MENIKWGVLGTAGIARGQTIPAMKTAENCTLFAIAGRSLEKAKEFRQEFGFEKAYGSYEALLNDPEVEAVYIPLPNDLHCEWTIRALNAKKHVLCEKPLAVSKAQEESMFRAAEENGVHLMEAFAYLHSPVTAAIPKYTPTPNSTVTRVTMVPGWRAYSPLWARYTATPMVMAQTRGLRNISHSRTLRPVTRRTNMVSMMPATP